MNVSDLLYYCHHKYVMQCFKYEASLYIILLCKLLMVTDLEYECQPPSPHQRKENYLEQENSMGWSTRFAHMMPRFSPWYYIFARCQTGSKYLEHHWVWPKDQKICLIKKET